MHLLSSLLDRLRSRHQRIETEDQLAQFIESRAAFVSQQCVTEFCRVRAGANWQQLFGEAEFQAALMRSTWMSHTPVLAMVCEMVEGVLRPHVEDPAEMSASLVRLAGTIRDDLVPPKEVDRDAWDAQAGLVADRLAHAALAAPRPVRHLADPLAHDVFKALPLHASLLTHDFDYIFNNLRMNLLRTYDDFVAIADPERIADSLAQR